MTDPCVDGHLIYDGADDGATNTETPAVADEENGDGFGRGLPVMAISQPRGGNGEIICAQ